MQIFRLGQHLTSHAVFSQTRDCGLLQVQIYISLCEGAGEDTVISLLKETALYDSAKMKPLGEIWISAVINSVQCLDGRGRSSFLGDSILGGPEDGQQCSLFLTEAPSVLSTFGEWNREEWNSISNYQALKMVCSLGKQIRIWKHVSKVTYTVNKDLI